jgi:hypothetical protein
LGKLYNPKPFIFQSLPVATPISGKKVSVLRKFSLHFQPNCV